MGKHGQLVIGPAGAGKSTYCAAVLQHCVNTKRSGVHIVNLDPAAETFPTQPSVDIRDLISLTEVMEEMNYGPNGALVYCFEYLLDNIEWLEEQLGDYEDDYLLFDCPGQIELFSHLPVMKTLTQHLQKWGYNVCAVYMLDAHFISEPSKFIAGSLSCLAAMMQLGLPHINVLTKYDLAKKDRGALRTINSFLDADMEFIMQELSKDVSSRFKKLNAAIASLLSDYSMVGFIPLDNTDEESIETVLVAVDNSIQYGEDLDVKVNYQEEYDDYEETGTAHEHHDDTEE